MHAYACSYPEGCTCGFSETQAREAQLRRVCVSVGNLAGEYERLRTAVRAASSDMHQASHRPCVTCMLVSKALHEPWGCYALQAARGLSVPDFTKH